MAFFVPKIQGIQYMSRILAPFQSTKTMVGYNITSEVDVDFCMESNIPPQRVQVIVNHLNLAYSTGYLNGVAEVRALLYAKKDSQ